jgi:hypothetical protein
MTQYLLLIETNTKTRTRQEEWDEFFKSARESGLFQGGSAIGKQEIVGDADSAHSTDFIGGYMNFDSDDKQKILDLLQKHPVAMHGGSMHLCEVPKT